MVKGLLVGALCTLTLVSAAHAVVITDPLLLFGPTLLLIVATVFALGLPND